MIVVDSLSNKLRPSKAVIFVDDLLKTKHFEGVWPVIRKIVAYWKTTNPKQYQSFIVDMQEKRSSRYRRSGSSKSGNIRSLIDIPERIIYIIRKVYDASELPMDKAFFIKFAKEFPEFTVAQRI